MEGHLGQDSWWNLLCTSGVWKTIGSRFLVEITTHFSSMEDHWVKILDGNYYTLLVYGRPFGSRFLVEITTHFCSMEDHCVKTLGENYYTLLE